MYYQLHPKAFILIQTEVWCWCKPVLSVWETKKHRPNMEVMNTSNHVPQIERLRAASRSLAKRPICAMELKQFSNFLTSHSHAFTISVFRSVAFIRPCRCVCLFVCVPVSLQAEHNFISRCVTQMPRGVGYKKKQDEKNTSAQCPRTAKARLVDSPRPAQKLRWGAVEDGWQKKTKKKQTTFRYFSDRSLIASLARWCWLNGSSLGRTMMVAMIGSI